jgi:hypothetical protein
VAGWIHEQIPPYSGNSTAQASQQYGEGVHLFSPFGFLDGTWFHRSYWVFGRSFASGAGGYYMAGRYAPAGRILTFNESCIYGFGRQPQYFKWTTPLEHQLFAAEKFPDSRSIEYRWTHSSLPLLVRAMVLAEETLFIAEPPDVVDEEQAFDNAADPDTLAKLGEQDAALEGAHGALLWAVSALDGSQVAGYNLESLPVWDGMIAANGRLYMSMENGTVQCLVGAHYPPTVDAGEDQKIYPVATAVLDGNTGIFEGFVNGESIGSVSGIAPLHSHPDNCAFGHVESATMFHDGLTSGPANFAGQVAEFHQYNDILSAGDRQTLENYLTSK